MKRKRLIIAGMIALLVIGSIASGCRHHSTPEEKMDRVIEYLTDDMDLTVEQTEILDKLKKDLIQEGEGIHMAKEDAHDIIIAQIKSEVMDQQQVTAAIAGVREEVGDFLDAAVSRFADFHQTLTPEQKEQLVKKLESIRKLHGCGH